MEGKKYTLYSRVSPRFINIPSKEDISYQMFFWSELLLYKPFRNIELDFAASSEGIIEQWKNVSRTYHSWHIRQTHSQAEEEDEPTSPSTNANTMQDSIPDE